MSDGEDDWDYGEEDKDPGATTLLKKISSIGPDIFNTRDNNVNRAYSIQSKEQVLQDRQQRIKDLCECTGLSEGLAAALLHKYKWLVQKTIDAFTSELDLLNKLFDFSYSQKQVTEVCESCFETSEEWVYNDDCNHCLCKQCY